MAAPNIKTTKNVVPMIYAYTTPEIKRHDGWTKIGYTEQTVEKRLHQQANTVDVKYHEEWRGNAVFEDGSGDQFRDTDFHAYLQKKGIEREPGHEWFKVSGKESKTMFYDFRQNRGILDSIKTAQQYTLRKEQGEAVRQTIDYLHEHENGEFLWNAKPRFGKTLSVYDFIKQISAQNVLIVTNRPAIANSWYSDYEQFLGTESGYRFVSNTDSLKGKPLVISREQYRNLTHNLKENEDIKCIEFVSLQDLKGSIYFGGEYDKLAEVSDAKDEKGRDRGIYWDVLVIDEAHEGVDTYKTDVAFDHIRRKFTLHLSGTPFKALANDKFPEKAIFNWTYADEQRAKHDWDSDERNPYETLPKLNMLTYQMSEIVKNELSQGVEINGETEEYAFDLNLFFETNGRGVFKYDASVTKFLDALTTQEKFPFSTEELRNELKHTFWLLNRVESAKALARKLNEHPVFKDYEVILAAGDGKLDDADETKKSFDRVKEAIATHDKTITLSVGQLTTGITIPEWTAVLMLSNIKSPGLYMQAAFRSQNPCMFRQGTGFYRKENAYVFDFDPARTLIIYEQFANDLNSDTAKGRGDSETRKEHIKELLNFFPVIGEDENGEMIELDAEKVLSIPRKIKSQEVVKRGFMSDFLFQNISNVFHAPAEVIDIISNFEAIKEPSKKPEITNNTAAELNIDDNGEVTIDDEYVIGRTPEIFGEKIYEDIAYKFEDAADVIGVHENADDEIDVETFKNMLHTEMIAPLVSAAQEKYQSDMKASDKNKIERKLNSDADRLANRLFGDYKIEKNTIEQNRLDELRNRFDTGKTEEEINTEYDQKQKEAVEKLSESIKPNVDNLVKEASKEIVKTVETNIKERKKEDIEGTVRDHLRGFSRTIPSFLMAYGDDGVTLFTFDSVIPDIVFKEVTSITLDQFRFLRDGGDYIDKETGETKHFDGNLFEPVVFDDSVKEFMKLKAKLSNYFDEQSKEDIFDYIPPQKTNQIFTPKVTVKKMVDLLEAENPGCFDLPDKTFIDLYMKSGLYITEIVKRLYRSENLKELYPDPETRLQHIFEKQVYGLAPTEIIYRIATNYILGFADDMEITKHNFKQADALPYAKEGKLNELLDELYGDD